MNKQPHALTLKEFIDVRINEHQAGLARFQNAINYLDGNEDKDILEALLVGRAYVTGAITEMELLLFAYC